MEDIQLLFSQGLRTIRDRALFGVCLYTACRVNEACTLLTRDIYSTAGIVRSEMIIRKGNTKGKLDTRTIPVIDDLRLLLTAYRPEAGKTYLFPSRHASHSWKHINSDSAARILRQACQRVGIEGISTHSFRRTALTQMSDAGIPLRVIQEVSGHRSLTELQKYLEVKPDQVRGAIASLSMLSHIGQSTYRDTITAEIPDRFVSPETER